jgi:hypothetical protein
MGFMLAMGRCVNCGKTFQFNPNYVPSLRHPDTGEKEPVCQDCIDRENLRRREHPDPNLPQLTIHPKAYQAEEVL